jgi:hypothetical protein
MEIGSSVTRRYEFDRMLAFWQRALGCVPNEIAMYLEFEIQQWQG